MLSNVKYLERGKKYSRETQTAANELGRGYDIMVGIREKV